MLSPTAFFGLISLTAFIGAIVVLARRLGAPEFGNAIVIAAIAALAFAFMTLLFA